MPTTVELPDNIELEFPDGMDELDIRREIAKAFPQFASRTPSESLAILPPGQSSSGGNLWEKPLIPEAFPAQTQRLQEMQEANIPELTGSEVEQMLLTPQVTIPNPVPKSWPVTRGIVQSVKMIPEAATAPAAPLITLAQGIPFVRETLDAAMGAGMVKSAAELAGEASATGDREKMAEAVTTGLLGAGMFAGPHVAPILANEVAARRVGAPDVAGVDIATEALRNRAIHEQAAAAAVAANERPVTGGLFSQRNIENANVALAARPKGERPVVPETPPEQERGLTVIQEIRAKGADTKEKIRALFPQLSRETAAKLRDQAFPKEKIPDNLSQADVDRLFLDKLNEQSNLEIQNASKERQVEGSVPSEPARTDALRIPTETGVSDQLQRTTPSETPKETEIKNKPPTIAPGEAPPVEAPAAGTVSSAEPPVAAPTGVPPAIREATTVGEKAQISGQLETPKSDWFDLTPDDQFAFMEAFERRHGDLPGTLNSPQELDAVMEIIYNAARARIKKTNPDAVDVAQRVNKKDIFAAMSVRVKKQSFDKTQPKVIPFEAKQPKAPPAPPVEEQAAIKQELKDELGPGMSDLGAATPASIPNAPTPFRHWWDVHFGRPAARLAPTIKALWAGREIRANMAKDRDVVDNQSKLFARSTANDIRQPLKRQFKKDFQVADNALSMVVEANGDPAALDVMRLKLIDSTAADPWWRKQALDALDFATYHWDALNKIARDYNAITKAQIGIERAGGLDVLERDAYVPHRQDFSDADFLLALGKGDSSFFLKSREYPTFADSIAAGVDPKELAATKLLENRLSAGMKLVNSRKWLENLREVQDPTTKQPIARNLERHQRIDGKVFLEPPPGYVKESIGPHDIAIHKGYEGIFAALTDPSAFTASTAGRAFMKANAAGKSINLLIDTFHLGRLAAWESIIKPLGIKTFKMPVPSYKRGLTLLDYTADQIREMATAGEIPKKWVPELMENKRRLDLAVKSGYNIGRISDALYQDVIHNLPVVGPFNKWLFDQFQRGAMAESWLLEFERAKRASPRYSEEALAREVTKSLNTRFGNLGRQGWLKSRTAQDTARTLFLAPQWNEGLIKAEAGAIGQAGRFVMDSVTGKRIYAGTLMRSVGAMALMQFMANQVINQATRGKFTWENPEEGYGAKLSAWIPDLAGNGPGFFLHPLGLAAEITHLLSNIYERTGRDFTKVGRDFLRSRSSAAMRPVWVAATGTDFLGRRPKPGTLWAEVLKSAVPTPISGGAAAAFGKEVITGQPSEQFAGQYQKQLMSSFGIKTEGAPSAEQRMNRLARNWREENGVPPNPVESGPGEYSDLIRAVRIGNVTDANSELERLMRTKTEKQILQYFRSWPKRPFTGSLAREREFRSSLSVEQEVAYIKAKDERERIAADIRALLR